MHTAGKLWYDGHGLSKTMIIRGNIVFLKFEEKLGRNRKDEFLDESSSDFYGHDFLTSKCLLSVPKGVQQNLTDLTALDFAESAEDDLEILIRGDRVELADEQNVVGRSLVRVSQIANLQHKL